MSVKAFLDIGYELVYADSFHFRFHLRDDRIGVGCSGLQIGRIVLINSGERGDYMQIVNSGIF